MSGVDISARRSHARVSESKKFQLKDTHIFSLLPRSCRDVLSIDTYRDLPTPGPLDPQGPARPANGRQSASVQVPMPCGSRVCTNLVRWGRGERRVGD